MNKYKFLTSLVVSGLLFGCAKERGIEELDLNTKEEWLGKTNFISNPIKKEGLDEIADSSNVWLYRTVVVKTSSNDGFAFVGLQNKARAGYFAFTEDKLKLYSAENVYPASNNVTPTIFNQWDIEHKDVRLQEQNGNVTNVEEEDLNRPWYEKNHFTIDWAKADVSEAADLPYYVDASTTFGCWTKKASQLVENSLEVKPEHFAFTVEVLYQLNSLCGSMRRVQQADYTYTVQYRYSFIPLPKSDYEPMVFNGESDPLMQRYGFFQTVREKINEVTGRFENVFMANRWHPGKEHNYYFAPGFPDKWKWIFNDPENGIFAKTNKLFEANGIKARFYARENTFGDGQVKKLGDLRYSFINVVEEMDEGAPFGYGPSDTNPFTGEIISGNINLWTGFLKYYMQRVKDNHERSDSTPSLFERIKQTLGKDKAEWGNTLSFEPGATGDHMHKILMRKTFAYPYWNSYVALDPQSTKGNVFTVSRNASLEKVLDGSSSLQDIVGLNLKVEKIVDSVNQTHKSARMHLPHVGSIYPVQPLMADARGYVINGEDIDDILATIMYRVSIHELGHTLNLRHNFYGSVDEKNFDAPRTGEIKNADGSTSKVEYPQRTSSVMDYLTTDDELHAVRDWAPYDKAALVFAYTSGAVDLATKNNTHYMYCTDEHRVLNAMCMVFDNGTTPTQAVMSLIENYESLYHIRNYRYGRAYWNTSGYAQSIFSTMLDMKKYYMLSARVLNDDNIRDHFNSEGITNSFEQSEISRELKNEAKEAMNLVMAFYDGVIQQSSSDRPWRDQYDDRSGAITRLGILYDKIFATRFLLGDESFMYDPSRTVNNPSFISTAVIDDPITGVVARKVIENTATSRVDMDEWFTSYARALYTVNATNYTNSGNTDLVNNIKINRFDSDEMMKFFNVDVTDANNLWETAIVHLNESKHIDFLPGDEVGLLKYEGYIYMTSKSRSPFAFNVFNSAHTNSEGDLVINRDKKDFVELYNMYVGALGLD